MSNRRVRRQEDLSTSAAGPLGQREVLFVRLVVEMGKWLELRRAGRSADDPKLRQQRGLVRGMVMCITKMWGNGYEPHWRREIRDCEEAARSLAGKWLRDGKPMDGEWWLKKSRYFWQSAIDQRGARGR